MLFLKSVLLVLLTTALSGIAGAVLIGVLATRLYGDPGPGGEEGLVQLVAVFWGFLVGAFFGLVISSVVTLIRIARRRSH